MPFWFDVSVMNIVVTHVAAHLAAEHPIGPSDVHQDHRQQHESADQQERLSALGRCCLPQREMVRHDHRIHRLVSASERTGRSFIKLTSLGTTLWSRWSIDTTPPGKTAADDHDTLASRPAAVAAMI